MKYELWGCVASLSAIAALSAPALGQTVQPGIADSSSAGEIIVTAQRKQERLQDVPIALTAFNSKSLREMNVNAPQDLFKQTPSIQIYTPASIAGFPIVNVRGVTLLDFSYASESSIASYRDGVYQGTTALMAEPLFDLERVEILRGPQGTLYGRNATGGLMSFVSAQPTSNFHARGMIRYQSHEDIMLDGAVSGPITDRIRVRFAARYNRNNGYQTDVVTGKGAGTIDFALDTRGIIAIDATDALKITLSAHTSDKRGKNDILAMKGARKPGALTVACPVQEILARQCVNSVGYSPPTFEAKYGYSGDDLAYELHGWGAQANIELDLGGVTLTSISAYEKIRKFEHSDSDGSPSGKSPVRVTAGYSVNHHQFSEELRLNAEAGRLSWQAGGFYYTDSRLYDFNQPGLGNWTDQQIQSWAVFGQGTYSLTDTLKFTAGGRYTHDQKKVQIAFQPVVILGTKLGSTPNFVYKGELTGGRATWRLGLDWHMTPDIMWFATASSGYKIGGYNTTGVASIAGVGPARPETIVSYELGVRADLLDHALSANITLYHSIWKGIQAAISVPVGGGLTQGVFGNLGSSNLDGIEAELTVRPTSNLSANIGLSLNKNKLRAPGVLIGGIPIDGNHLPNTPSTRLMGSASWEPRLDDGSRLLFGVDASYQTKVWFRPDNYPAAIQPAYAIMGGRIGWADSSNRYRVELFGQNLTNKQYVNSGTNRGDSAVYAWGQPRIIGARLSAEY